MYIVQGVKTAKIQELSRWYPVVLPMSCLANVSFTSILGRLANVLSHFANIRVVG